MRRKTIIIIISVIAIIAGLSLGLYGFFSNKVPQHQSIEVGRGTVKEIISATGAVKPAQEFELQFENTGKIERIEIKVGDAVKAGQTLMALNANELFSQLQVAEASLDIARAQLSQTLTGARPEEIRIYQTAVINAQTEVSNKEQDLTNAKITADNHLKQAYESVLNTANSSYTSADKALLKTFSDLRQKYFGGSSNQITSNINEWEDIAKNDLFLAKTYLDQANSNPINANIDLALNQLDKALRSIKIALATMRTSMGAPLYQDRISSADRGLIDAERTSIDNVLTAIISAKQNIVSTQIANQNKINQAEFLLDSAQSALKTAQDQLILKQAGPRQSDVDLAQAQVKQAQANLNQILEKINKSILRSPVDGLIIEINKEKGEIVSLDQPVVSLIASSDFEIEANISETEIAKVELNDKILMTLDAFGPNEIFDGSVIKINPAETVVSGVIYYRVTAVINNKDSRIKPGMTVNLEIETAQKDEALYLPYYAIKEKDGQKYVLVLENNQAAERLIKTGLEGENEIEILEGLKQGEAVLLETE